jgi:hypothetical protein
VGLGFIFLAGWAATASIWTECEIILPNRNEPPPLPSWCPQSALSIPIPPDPGVVLHYGHGLAITRDSLAWVDAVLYGVYAVSGLIAWWNGVDTRIAVLKTT